MTAQLLLPGSRLIGTKPARLASGGADSPTMIFRVPYARFPAQMHPGNEVAAGGVWGSCPLPFLRPDVISA